jgi:hypothetical protein
VAQTQDVQELKRDAIDGDRVAGIQTEGEDGSTLLLKTYNGFDHDQRMKGFRWLQGEYAAGRRTKPIICDACGQTEQPITAHSEDYSEPFGDHIGQHGLCYRCHMMIHCRFKAPEAWETYKLHIRQGRILVPISNFQVFCGQTLKAKGRNVPFKQGPVREHTLLDDLKMPEQPAGLFDPQ